MRVVNMLVIMFLLPAGLVGQTRLLLEDPTLDNLRHPADVKTGTFGSLGHVRKVGEGGKIMLLIPGLGFGDVVWSEFMERHRADYTMFAITLPGFGNTPPLPMPPEGSRYADMPWT